MRHSIKNLQRTDEQSYECATLKEQQLREIFRSLGSVVVAYSGGVDSSYVAYVANAELGPRAICITGQSASVPVYQQAEIERVVSDFGFHHEVIQTDELDNPSYQANNPDRCYFCKDELYHHLSALARARGFDAVVDGNNADDRGDYRPGRQAAREHGVRSPLDDVDLTKEEIRMLSRRAGLPTWDVPASACLSSRIPYGDEVTEEKLRAIERAEQVLEAHGFRVFRVRHHDTLARLEIARDEMARALEPDLREAIVRELKAVGYQHVTIDLQGYRLGSLNEVLRLKPVS